MTDFTNTPDQHDHLRALLLRLMHKFPLLDDNQLREKYLAEVRRSPELVDEALRLWFRTELAETTDDQMRGALLRR